MKFTEWHYASYIGRLHQRLMLAIFAQWMFQKCFFEMAALRQERKCFHQLLILPRSFCVVT